MKPNLLIPLALALVFPAAAAAVVNAPSDLQAVALSSSEIQLTWTDNSTNEDRFRVQIMDPDDGRFRDLGIAPANTALAIAGGLQPSTLYKFRVRAEADGDTPSGFSNEASVSTLAPGIGACEPGSFTLCIDDQPNDQRFEVSVDFRTVQGGGHSGAGRALPLSSLGVNRGGIFWFFALENPEILVKVLNGCGRNNRYWVYFSAGTNVGFTLRVRDTVTGATFTTINPDLRPAPPVQNVNALPCSVLPVAETEEAGATLRF